MEEKKYEAGKVEISSAEYRDLIEKMVEAQNDASVMRSEKWKLEDERRKLSQELEAANKKIAELESQIRNIHTGLGYPDSNASPYKPWWSEVTYLTNNGVSIKKEEN